MTRRLTPEQDLERLLDEDAGEFGAIYARLSRPEPPRRLDRVVLANAARAIHGGRAPRVQRWALALGSVAGVVLAAGIAWQVGKQMQTHESVPEGSRSMQDSRVVPVEAITEPRPRQKSSKDLIMRDGEIPLGARDDAAKPVARMNKQDKASTSMPAEIAVPAAPAAAPPAPQATASPEKAKSPSAPGDSQPAQAAAATIDRAQVEAEAFPSDRDSKLEESAPRAERARPAAKKSAAAVAGNATMLESRDAGAEPRSSEAAAMSADESADQDMQLPPEAWLEEIERLASSGQRGKAVENLRLFRSQYPDWPLPDALRQLDP